ncbi:MAG: restriction endonuclease [Akkermansiaceae bacterium]|nr:restriction endonuclease [Akkermansiaceae bacterium]
MDLSHVIECAAIKSLTAVDLPDRGSNQHELNGGILLRKHFGIAAKTTLPISWMLLDEGEALETEEGIITFYDARAKSAHKTGRSEWRVYYSGDFLSRAVPGDSLILARLGSSESYLGLVLREGSTAANAARILFGVEPEDSEFDFVDVAAMRRTHLEFVERRIIETLGLEPPEEDSPDHEELVVTEFGEKFPTTMEMSRFARSVAGDSFADPDASLMAWLETEEGLFRALEKTIVKKKLDAGFASVDEFVSYSLSVQNRRKSRMGHALQNHLHFLLQKAGLKFTSQATTERNNRPDFLFPGENEYHDPNFPAGSLFVLAAKSTAKDRWRQILTEADRIPSKHLCTVQPAITPAQTDEMWAQGVVLVLPTPVRATYSPQQQSQSLCLSEFLDRVSTAQG